LSSINKSFGSLPIYDSIIANRLYGRRYVEFRDVLSYWREILDVSRDRSCSATVLERHIFNALRAGVGSVTAPPPAGNVG
jgi:hypothetical protein